MRRVAPGVNDRILYAEHIVLDASQLKANKQEPLLPLVILSKPKKKLWSAVYLCGATTISLIRFLELLQQHEDGRWKIDLEMEDEDVYFTIMPCTVYGLQCICSMHTYVYLCVLNCFLYSVERT